MIWFALGPPIAVVVAIYVYVLGVAAGEKRQSEIEELAFENRLAEKGKKENR